ncbi:tRNA (guanine(10)-N2)-methyltransferase homolog [Daphnia carinata]|uniref:tRNA (guanine(10)-N2)-methyltransferase homolog n=1 Tax=Daphnia carinata TaxID=120202 RepID=UPI00257E6151|nr:tRNA (guanine(10)-N2)-methyltransferase homolog [Daphnia carinata]
MAARHTWKSYLLWCANEHVSFRIPEVEAILAMYKIPHTWIEKPAENPWMLISMPSEDCAVKLMKRSVTVRSIIELWARATTKEHLDDQLKTLPTELTSYFEKENTFKVVVDTFNKVTSQEDKIKKIESFSFLPILGTANLKNPSVTYHYYEFFGLDAGRIPEKPFDYFFGRWVSNSERSAVEKYSLKTRHFIGNTSMDPKLSMIMANLAQIDAGHIVVDPFVGTGSLLVAAAHFGGYVCGTDIDYLTLHGKMKPSRAHQKKRQPDEDIKGNLKAYNLFSRYLDVFVGDASRPVWRPEFRFDSIITDPPYGIRESTEKVGSKKVAPVPEELASPHFPSKTQYGLGDMYKDLLNFAANNLKLNGRVVFWIPIIRMEYDPDLLPEHPCLERVSNSEQILNLHSSRRLITMQKTMEPKEAADSAIIHDLQYTFRHKFFNTSEIKGRAREDVQAEYLTKRSKRGNGVAKLPCHE